ncbi:MAG: glycosyltransferase family 2 protein [Verrucomicrobia bacterium]|nr:glycosyltransferase family 2 protein [Verrucomicrobiota bacterium]
MKLFLTILFSLIPFSSRADSTSFVILILSYNNEKWVKQNIFSALNQEYSNYRILYVNDASTDKTLAVLNELLENHPKKDFVNIYTNFENKGPASNFYHYIHHYIQDNEVIVNLDGDDQLAHSQVLSDLDEIYSNPLKDIWITYGQYQFQSSGQIGSCVKKPYLFEKAEPLSFGYRKEEFRFSHLRTFKGWLFKQIRKKDLLMGKDFVSMAADVAINWPMIEMASNGHFEFIDKIMYIYNDMNVLNEHRRSIKSQTDVHGYIARKPAYIPLD